MASISLGASTPLTLGGRSPRKARRLWDEAVEEAQAIAAEALLTADRAELAARANYLALFLGELDQEGCDLNGPIVLRPIWNARIEVPLREAPAMLRSLLSAA